MRLGTAIFPALLASACGPDPMGKVRQSTSETFVQVPPTPADILWVVDDSVSMEEEQFRVMDGAASFVDSLARVGVDFHLGVITTDVTAASGTGGVLVGSPPYLTPDDVDYADIFHERVDVGIAGDDQESGLEAAVLAVTEPNRSDTNAGFFRDEARLEIIVVSDEQDCSDFGTVLADDDPDPTACYKHFPDLTPVADILARLTDLKADSGLVQVSAIVGLSTSYCPTASVGSRYSDAVALTDGYSGNICRNDYQRIMGEVGLVAAGLQDSFLLSFFPVQTTIEVWTHTDDSGDLEVSENSEDGWTYEDDPPAIRFHGSAVPERGATITVFYDY